MTIEKYTELTGNSVPSNRVEFIKSQIKRAQSSLEAMLGYPLDKVKAQKNHYDEKGKTVSECGDVGETLNDPDEVIGAYRLFSYNEKDMFLSVDPFEKLNKVKLVRIVPGEEDENGVTIKTFDDDDVRVHMKNGFSKYIQVCQDCFCVCSCRDCVQLAVDADWLYTDCLPLELLYIWCDIVDYNSDPKGDIKSETLGSHSYTRFDGAAPWEDSGNLTIISKYAGPNGSLYADPT